MKITKRNGNKEDFNSAKVERSVRNSGADEKTSKEIAKIISEKKSESTKDIRWDIGYELKNNTEVANNYNGYRTLVARRAVEAARGIARLSKEGMANLNLKPGDKFTVMHGTKTHSLEVDLNDKTDIRWNEIRLHEEDLKAIGTSDGKDILAHRN